MSVKFISNFVISLHLISMSIGSIVGSYEVHQKVIEKDCYCSKNNDTIYIGSARGAIRGLYYPFNVIKHVPIIWNDEKPKWL